MLQSRYFENNVERIEPLKWCLGKNRISKGTDVYRMKMPYGNFIEKK